MMKKIIKYLIATLVLIPIIFLVVLSIVYNPTYVYRLVFYNVGDVYDYKHFERRVIKTNDSVFYFQKKIDEDYVESLFVDQINNSGCQTFDEWAEKSKTTALIFIRQDTILYEKYFNGFKRGSYFHSMSMAKSFISTLIGFAIQDGFISNINDPITKYIPELKERDIRFEKITIKNLMMMQSGIKYYQGYFPGTFVHLPWHDEAIGYYHPNVRKLLLEDIEIKDEPGKTRLELQTQFELMPSMLVARAIDYAKFGRLFLNDGNWNGKQVISKEWVSESTIEDKSVPRKYYPNYMGSGSNRVFYKYQWWGHANSDSTYNFLASGNFGQSIYVIPHEEIIIVHCGNSNALYNSQDLWQIERLIKYKDFHHLITHKGVKAGIEEFRIKRKNNSDSYPINERIINTKGYAYLNNGKIEEAILLFLLNVELFPTSSNVYDSLAEAYMINGDKQKAISNYQKSLELNPNNGNAKKMINELTRNSP